MFYFEKQFCNFAVIKSLMPLSEHPAEVCDSDIRYGFVCFNGMLDGGLIHSRSCLDVNLSMGRKRALLKAGLQRGRLIYFKNGAWGPSDHDY